MAELWALEAPGISIRRDDPARAWLLRLRAPDLAVVERIGGALGVDLPTRPNRAAGERPRAQWLGPGEWCVLDAAVAFAAVHVALGTGAVHLANVTDGLVRYRIEGARARDLLAKSTTLDLHPRAFVPDDCVQSALALTRVVIDHDRASGLSLYAGAEYAHHLEAWFADASREFLPRIGGQGWEKAVGSAIRLEASR